jgi:hypothetical protein
MNININMYTYTYIYMYMYIYRNPVPRIVPTPLGPLLGWLFIVKMFCYICIFYYLYVDSLTYAFGWSALHFCVGLDFSTPLDVMFFK